MHSMYCICKYIHTYVLWTLDPRMRIGVDFQAILPDLKGLYTCTYTVCTFCINAQMNAVCTYVHVCVGFGLHIEFQRRNHETLYTCAFRVGSSTPLFRNLSPCFFCTILKHMSISYIQKYVRT